MRLQRSLSLAIILAGSIALPASAFVEADQNATYEIDLPSFSLNEGNRLAAPALRVEASARSAFGGEWHVARWDDHAKSPRQFYGSGVALRATLVGLSDAEIERVAREAIARAPEVFGTDGDDLRFVDVTRGMGKVAAHFQQVVNGIDVIGATAYTQFTEDTGRLYIMGSTVHREVDVVTAPSISDADAARIAQASVPFDPTVDTFDADETTLLVLPMPVSPTDASYHLVWRVRVPTSDPIGIWVTDVDANTGQILQRKNDVHFLDYEGHVDSNVQPNTFCNGSEIQNGKYFYVDIDGLPRVTTDANGDFTVVNGDELDRTLTSSFSGPWARVSNNGGANGAISTTATPGVPLNLEWDDTNSQADERDVFAAVQDIRDFILPIDPNFNLISSQMLCNVSIGQSCNAFWNGTINFYIAGGSCANTGEIQGVVHHEYGHGVQNSLIGGQGQQGLGEGNSDVLANLITQESIIARGFFNNCNGGIRNSNNSLQYPDDLTGQVHNDGRIIAGFHWDLMEIWQAKFGVEEGTRLAAEYWHFARKVARPQFQPDQVLAVFAMDDDDGDLTNGSPLYLDICEAADNHGYDCPAAPGVHILGGHVWNQTEVSVPVPIVATPFSTQSTINPATVDLHYRVNGGSFITVDMTDEGDGNFSATFPGQVLGNLVEYYVEAADFLGNIGRAPAGAPGELWEYYTATYYDPAEGDVTGWTIGLPDDDADNGIWEWVYDPVGTAAQPTLDNTPAPGTGAWITGQHDGAEGGSQANSNVNSGKTTLTSPVYDISGSEDVVLLQYNRWFSNDTGAFEGEDPWIVRISNDAGATWTEVENTLESDRSWRFVEHDILAMFTVPDQLQVQFEAADYSLFAIVEAGVDDLTVIADLGVGTVEVGSAPSGVPAAIYLAEARPNPFNPQTTIGYGITEAGRVTLTVFDITGRRIRGLVDTSQSAGHHAVRWDGRDDAGQSVGSGIYFYRIQTPEGAETRRMTLLK